MNNIIWLVLANIIIWLGFGFYLFFLGSKQKNLKRKLERLEMLENGSKN